MFQAILVILDNIFLGLGFEPNVVGISTTGQPVRGWIGNPNEVTARRNFPQQGKCPAA